MSTRLERRHGLEQSFALSSALLIVLAIGATMLIVHSRTRATMLSALEARGHSIAASIGAVARPSLLAYNYAALQIAAEGAVGDPDVAYVIIHDKEGVVAGIAGRGASPAGAFPLPGANQSAASRRLDLPGDPNDTEVLEAVSPVRVEGVDAPWGTVRVGMDFTPVRAGLRQLDIDLIVIGLVLAVGAVGASRWMARRLAAPLRRLVEGTEALSSGDTSYRIPVSGPRELAELAHGFNEMMDRVRDKDAESAAYQEQLAALNATLEHQVRERTLALEESEAQYRTLVDHTPDSILIVQHGRVRFVNRAFEETFGIDGTEAVSADFRLDELFDDADRQTLVERLEAWERGEATSPAALTTRRLTDGAREVELRGSRIEFRGVPAVECMLVDMTETRRLREKLEDAQRLRALGELSSGVAHDFNNLLGAILGRAQLLRNRGFDRSIDGELAVIEKAARDGRETVRRIQEFSRTRADRTNTPVDLGEAMRDALEITRTFWSAEASRRNVRVDVDTCLDAVEPVEGSAAELREVFTNLIINAVDAMPQGGTLHLSCGQRGDRVVAEVSDTGVGMTEEIRRHLFDPFFTTKGQSGTGLGMSVVYGIVTRHGGSIEVTTELGHGTRFALEFPACERVGRIAAAAAATGLAVTPRRGRILVIDDEQPIAELLEDALSGDGHEVEVALSAIEGLKMADLRSFDLVMTDLGMPDMSGWEVASRIRASRPHLPIVLVTGWGTTISEDEIVRAGVAAVVHKPFEIADLLETTTAVLARGDEVDAAVEPG